MKRGVSVATGAIVYKYITETIKAVAKGTESIISGKDTPTRVVLEDDKK